MELHGNQPIEGRKEITCSDCGHLYVVAQGQTSACCQVCGNIEFFGTPNSLDSLSQSIVAKRILPRLERTSFADPLAAFQTAPDAGRVEEMRFRYQVEWQLWAMVVKHFGDSAFHMAYLTQSMMAGDLEKATERYRDHRLAMATLADSRWQAEVADLMLSRIENLSISRMPIQSKGTWFPGWIYLAPFDARFVKLAWVVMGLGLAARLIHVLK